MFRAILETQWKWTRGLVLLAALFAFAVPLGSMGSGESSATAQGYLGHMAQWAPMYSLLAAGLGLLVALSAWANDHRGRHVYALALPVTRARYVLMRLGAGVVFMLIPIAALLLSAVLVSTMTAIPAGLHAYPIGLTLRFALAAFVAYAIFFAIAASTQKTAGMLLGAIAAVLLVQYGLSLVGVEYDLMSRAAEFLFNSPGILSVFSGRWMLVDV